MNKKNLFITALLVFIFIGTTATCTVLTKAEKRDKSSVPANETNRPAAEANVLSKDDKKGEPAGGYFNYYGVDYPVYDPEQWTMINEELKKYEVHGKDLLNKLGVLTESQLNCTIEDVKKCLSKLEIENMDSAEYEVIRALNNIAGSFERCGGSGFVTYNYAFADGTGCQVRLGGRVNIGSKLIFVPGYGYNADGWDYDYLHEQEQIKAQKIMEEMGNNN